MATQASTAADSRLIQDVSRQVARRVVGQEYMVDRLLISLLTGGHVLLEGVPGLAKTLTVRTLAETIDTTLLAHPVHARPAAGRRARHADLRSVDGQVHR